jgi:aspartyl-tRNA(Asn)/glutamyl-tRNA(Gln) amidotransferase subunit C
MPPSPPPSSDIDVVLRTARLARLRIDEREAARLGGEFARILAAFQDLASADVTGVEPIVQAVQLRNVLREDEPRASLAREAVLGSAPVREGDFFAVPKTVESGT